ncbi:MAG: 3-oxoacyl-ACP reductase [Gammaproteobacteria bacterium RIFCSPLOWO2_02_FULL_42_14]|nr:MAG: 3-oxoacyl-ACP reductase [Gammaproteobacteria bacterium RIFCSPHIGHO2_02_FULL_42_43]OGT27382.1 MAG: 3-oxoacyl-ACP reductase [Gammaproteobacteria bacterium RIFCSPHIGHO2_01_FULL_42_8]OGT52303.1 MAG: 3-oxoacyl-ACP reductase [Gammaproteobacteria bacterium RIFCSPHIGHO2_12_FULL_41_25]OGT61915.1 MAG: 3-oxoacyl-ACP reductase [Gammaproteobacteria bacterium RIFCSPLOWO2_02_FULL_42_14]OGT86374.1 MAG: 3-oxoacyl-ACP reductase [Gammaproteobacteria bacterium RIFCSPLOWO2_12_FULL_42_18]
MRRVLITGASRGIGKATAIMLAHHQFYVLVHYNKDEVAANDTLDMIKSSGGSGEIVSFDILDREACKATITKNIEKNGALYGVVCNASINHDVIFPSMTGEHWDAVVHTNLDGFFNVLKPCVMPMIQARKGGRIVTLTSVSGIVGNRGQVNYSASKAGIIGATKALALELAKRNITVNCVAPGLVDTDMIANLELDRVLKSIPARRVASPEEVAGLINYLMSDIAGYVTRQVISINGGLV